MGVVKLFQINHLDVLDVVIRTTKNYVRVTVSMEIQGA